MLGQAWAQALIRLWSPDLLRFGGASNISLGGEMLVGWFEQGQTGFDDPGYGVSSHGVCFAMFGATLPTACMFIRATPVALLPRQ